MVTAFLLKTLAGVVAGLWSLIPAWTVDFSPLATIGTQVGSWGSMMQGYFPVATLAVCLGIVLSVKFGLLGWRLIVFIYHQFWGSD